jgi:hypothetical protein
VTGPAHAEDARHPAAERAVRAGRAGRPVRAGRAAPDPETPPRPRALPALPWVAILVITSVVQFIRDAPLDGVVFAVVAAALFVDLTGLVPAIRRLGRPGTLPVLVGMGVVWAVLAFTPRHGIVDGIVLAGLGIAVAPYAWAGVTPRTGRDARAIDERALRRTAVAWALAGIATCVWELTSFILGQVLPQREALQHPAISDLLDPALDQLWFRALFVAAWLALGLALITRGRR